MKPQSSRASVVKPTQGATTMRTIQWAAMIAACLCANLFAETAKPETNYTWKNGELYRFEYSKVITIKQPNEEGVVEDRQTEISGVLILEIKSVSGAGAAATLRFDSPRVTLPTIRFFSAQYDTVEAQVDKTRSVARAIEGAIKSARWTVLLKPDGAVQIDSRTPASINEWLKETGNSGGWRKKSQELMLKLMEQDLGLKAQTLDRETFACLSPLPDPSSVETAEVLHPVRSRAAVTSQNDEKAQLAFQRIFERKQDTPYVLPQLTTSSNTRVKAQVEGVNTADGSAVFDTKLGYLDTLSEDYTVKLKYNSGKDSLSQEVRVQYKLKRLAPAIVKNE